MGDFFLASAMGLTLSESHTLMTFRHASDSLMRIRQDNRVCLVHFKIARDARRLLEFAILVWTIPAPVVQIHLAIFGHRIKPSLANDAEHGTEIVKRVAAGIFSISDAIGPRQ